MKLKSKFSFNFTGSGTGGNTWKGYRKCKVKASVKVKVPAGEFDTYRIHCSVDWETKTYWFAPDLGHSVVIKRKHKHDGSKNYTLEFVKQEEV